MVYWVLEEREIKSLQDRAGISRVAGEVASMGGVQIGIRSIGESGILHTSEFQSPLTLGAPNSV